MSHTALILLAAGNSSRMGEPKQLLEIHHKTLIRRAAETALASVCDSVIVVIGAEAARMRSALAGLAVETVENPEWRAGMGTSIRCGVEAAQSHDADGIILALADQPLVSAASLNKLVLTNRATSQPIVASWYADTVGVPAYFAREFFPHLIALNPEQGCQRLILAHPEATIRLACPEAEADIDTPEDFRRISELLR
jgi:molybdenum cofactor cytidylyltransferase